MSDPEESACPGCGMPEPECIRRTPVTGCCRRCGDEDSHRTEGPWRAGPWACPSCGGGELGHTDRCLGGPSKEWLELHRRYQALISDYARDLVHLSGTVDEGSVVRAVRLLNHLGSDPEADHCKADEIILRLVDERVRAAYQDLVFRSGWWATA